jgi:hypothetical protein
VEKSFLNLYIKAEMTSAEPAAFSIARGALSSILKRRLLTQSLFVNKDRCYAECC